MTYADITDYNLTTTGIDGALCYVRDISPMFFPMLLFAFFLVLAVGSYVAQKKYSLKGNITSSIAVGSFLTLLMAIFMTLSDCLINFYILGIWGAITIVSVILLFMQKEPSY